MAVGIVRREGQETDTFERWHSTEADVRFDQELCGSILEFIAAHHVKSVVMSPGIIGCAHEEGVDYTLGQTLSLLGKRGSLDGRGHPVNRKSSNPRLQRTGLRLPLSRKPLDSTWQKGVADETYRLPDGLGFRVRPHHVGARDSGGA